MKLLLKIWSFLFGWMKRESREARDNVSLHSLVEHQIYTKKSTYQNRVEWCRAFNKRNGYVVTERSPISIYFSTH